MAQFIDRVGGLNSSLAIKAPVRVATTAAITLSGFQTVDGVALAEGDWNLRVLVKNQTDATENGIYDASSSIWVRSKDFDGNADFSKGTRVVAVEGDTQSGTWVVTSDTETTFQIDIDDIDFSGPIAGLFNYEKSVFDYIPASFHAAIRAYTSTVDVSTYINTALAALGSATGSSRLLFPKGKYRITSAIGQDGLRNVELVGEGGLDLTYAGNSGTVIEFTGTGSGNAVTLTGHRGVWVRDMQIVYTSNSFTGTVVNLATTFTTGCGSGFQNVQIYQITGTGRTAGQCYYLKNNVDVTFINCYVSHANYGWLGLFETDATSPTNETNIVKLYGCTSIALNTAAIVNPIVGWSCYGCNFELSASNAPAGIVCTGAHSVTNLGLYSCVFADSTAAGTWINMPVSVFGFTMIGGGLLTNTVATGTGILLGAGGKVIAGVVIHGVIFSGLSVGINFAVAGSIASIQGNNFLNTTTPISGAANLDATSIVVANNGYTATPLQPAVGGTGLTTFTVGDIITATGSGTLAVINDVATGNALISGGAGVIPLWGKIGATTHIATATANRLFGWDGSGNPSLITQPAAGLVISGGALALANDLSALEALSSAGLAARTGTDTWAQRTITGTSNQTSITNGDGVSGNPTIALAFPAHIYITATATAVNMNAVADTTLNISLPAGSTRFRIQAIMVHHASADLTAATTVQYGLFTSAGGGGTTIAAAQNSTISSTAESTNNNFQSLTLAITASFNNSQLFFRVTTAHGSAATADVTLQICPLP